MSYTAYISLYLLYKSIGLYQTCNDIVKTILISYQGCTRIYNYISHDKIKEDDLCIETPILITSNDLDDEDDWEIIDN